MNRTKSLPLLILLTLTFIAAGGQTPVGVSELAVSKSTIKPADDPLGKIEAYSLLEPCPAPAAGAGGAAKLAEALKAVEDPAAEKRVEAITRIAALCAPAGIEPLIAALRDNEAEVRIAAARALGTLRDEKAIDPLVEAASDPEWRVRAVLARTLASYQSYRATNTTLNIIANPGSRKSINDEGDLRARCLAILMVNQVNDVRFSRKGIGFVFAFLDYQDPALRRVAEETMVQLKATRNGQHEMIGIAVKGSYPDHRIKALSWIGRWKLTEARERLSEIVAAETNQQVKSAAVEALAALNKP